MNVKPWSALLLMTLSLSVSSLTKGQLPAQNVWAVASARRLDTRLERQLSRLAQENRARIRLFPSARQASRAATLVIELRPRRGLESFRQVLSGNRAGIAAPAAELARDGYLMDASYTDPAGLKGIRVTAATAAGFHNALLRVPALLRTRASDLATDLQPPAKSVRVEDGSKAIITDFPSFPERGIVEGFYGAPWSHADRLEMLRFEGRRGMNVYYYAPKDDPYHRKLWRTPYPPRQMRRLQALVSTARENLVDFCFAISPGLSMAYSSPRDFRQLAAKLESVRKLGVSCFALFVDDVPQELVNPEDRKRFKTLGAAHVYLTNKLYRHLKSRPPAARLVLTPTTYTNEWGNRDYVRELGEGVNPDVGIVWTGPKVVSPQITAAQAKEWGELLRRPPLIWDNFPVNDGITWRPNLGPLVARDADLPTAVRGLFSNPMNQARASMIPLQTVADYLWNAQAYDPRRSLERALADRYGDEAALLSPFLKTYGDYWWDENLFRPLFVQERRAFDTRELEERLAQLSASMESLRTSARFQLLVPELAPFLSRTRERLAQVRASPAFQHLSAEQLQWDPEHDVLNASRVNSPVTLDGDFAKWRAGPLYELDRPAQIVGGARHWRGPSQLSTRFALGWDESYLYVAVDVTNPKLYQAFVGRGIDKGDAVVLTLETAFRKNFEKTDTEGDEYQLFFSPGNFSGVEPSVFSDEDYLPPRPQPRNYAQEIKTAWRKTATGFSGDIAIPVSWFEGGRFQAGYEIGFGLVVQKAVPPRRPAPEEEPERIVFSSKTDPLFPLRFGNPSSYQRLVLAEAK